MSDRLTLHVWREGDRFRGVEILSGRRLTLASGLTGQTVDRALSFLPMIFSLCGRAQGIAAARAVEAAIGRPADARTEAARRLVLAAEALQELWTPMLMDWPAAIGLPPRVEDARRLRRTLEPLWNGCARVEVERILTDIADFAPALEGGMDALDRYAARADAPGAAMLRHLAEQGLQGFGAAEVAPLPATADLGARLAADADGAFVRAPTWNGGPAETGPLARQWAHPTIVALREAHGAGLLARVAARLVDASAQVREMRDSAHALWQTGADQCATPLPEVGEASGKGAGRAEAARGTLVHWVDIAEGKVRDWRILAPTEWTFHPDGPLARGLDGTPTGPEPAARVRLLAMALDPCVAFHVTVNDVVTADA